MLLLRGTDDLSKVKIECSVVEPETVRAYLETEYRIASALPITLRIGSINEDLQEMHRIYGVECSAFITACNPLSIEFSNEQNKLRQIQLGKQLTSLGLAHIPGIGVHPSNNWPGEESYLILGLGMEAAISFGESYQQNGIL